MSFEELKKISDSIIRFNSENAGDFQIEWCVRPADFPVLVSTGDSKIVKVEENGKS